jgi:predicted nucleotidyltransferase
MSINAIGDALFTKTQQRVLGLLYGTPDKSFYTSEIFRHANMGRGTVLRELEKLVAADLLTVTVTGNQRHYQANPVNPVYTELVSMVRKSFGLADVVRTALKTLEPQITIAFIYGSIAKHTDAQGSDIDLMLVGDVLNYGEVMELLLPLESSLQRTISPTLYTPAEFRKKLAQGSSFLKRVMEQPKIMIKGVINGLAKPGGKKAATPGTNG